MKIVQDKGEGFLKLSIAGDLDANSSIYADEVIQKAFDTKQFKIIIDCKQLNYISSAGLGVFVSHIDNFKTNKGDLVLYNLNNNVLDVFKTLGLDSILKIVTNESDARALFN